MIYVTGDIHGNQDIKKLTSNFFVEQDNLTKNDYVIICGDFGLVWNDSKEDKYWLKWLSDKNFTTLFVDGNHENFDLLEKYPITKFCGGDVQYITESVIHLMRGQIYNIDGNIIFTMGGGTSVDRIFRQEGISFWKQEQPTLEEFKIASDNLIKYNQNVDYIITHTASVTMMNDFFHDIKEKTNLNVFLDQVKDSIDFKKWYFGHFHKDESFDNGKYNLLYQKIVKLGES